MNNTLQEVVNIMKGLEEELEKTQTKLVNESRKVQELLQGLRALKKGNFDTSQVII